MSKRKKSNPEAPSWAYRYRVIRCPSCSGNLTVLDSIRVILAVAGSNSEFLTRLDSNGVLIDVDSSVAKGLHSGTECVACDFDLVGYEEQFQNELPGQPELLPFPWSHEGLVQLYQWPPGDIPEMARRLALYLAVCYHQDLASLKKSDFRAEAEKDLARMTAEVWQWLERIDAAVARWRNRSHTG